MKWLKADTPSYVQLNPDEWKPYESNEPVYRSFQDAALDDFLATETIKKKNLGLIQEISFSKRPFGAAGWFMVKVNPVGLEFYERIYEPGTHYEAEQEVATHQPITIDRIMGFAVPSISHLEKSRPEIWEKIQALAEKHGIPIVEGGNQLIPIKGWLIQAKGYWHLGEKRRFRFDINSTPTKGKFRLYPPGRLEGTFYRKTRTSGVTYTIGKHPKTGKWLPRCVIFDKKKFTEKQAEKWFDKNQSQYDFKFYDER